MAENTVSQNTPTVKEISPIHLEFLDENRPAVLSTEVAERFQKKHQHILRDIDRIHSQVPKIFFETNFGLIEREVAVGFGMRRERSYLLTRDAFSLLVMGFTGSAAIRWKLKYIEAFNSLEAAVRDNIRTDAVEYGRKLGLDEARALPAVEKERKAAYLDGMKEGEKLQKKRDGLTQVAKIKSYRDKGLTLAEIGKLLGVTKQAVSWRICRARKLGVAI